MKGDDVAVVAVGIGIIVIACLFIIIVQATIDALVLVHLWAWFAVPLFGVPMLTMIEAMGLSALISFMTTQYVPTKDSDTYGPLVHLFVRPFLFLAFGACIHGLM